MLQLEPGDKAPAFGLLDQRGEKLRLSDFKGQKVLLYFYPKADTPGCTTQSCELRDALCDFQAKGLQVLGVSPDTPEKQRLFAEKFNLGFPLLSDPDHKVADKYGVWGERSLYGNKYMGIIRSAFLIDEKGRILEPFYKVSPKQTVPKALKFLKSLE